MRLLILATSFCLLQLTNGYYDLKPLGMLQLPTSLDRNGNYLYSGIDLGTAREATFDPTHSILYVIGDKSHFLHIVDISDPNNPQLLFVHKFTVGDGIPQSIDICGEEVAVGLSAMTDVLEGHVQFFHAYQRGSGASDLVLDGAITVGPHPSHIKYAPNCDTLVIANEGRAGKDQGGLFTDPEGSISLIVNERTGNPSVRLVDFNEYDIGASRYNPDIRVPSLYIPLTTHSPSTTISRDFEPENIAVSADGRTAWVSLQDNNAVAKIDINNGLIDGVESLPKKNWSALLIDTSDRDGDIANARCFYSSKDNSAVVELSLDNYTVTRIRRFPNKDWTGIPVDVSDRDGGVHRRAHKGLQSLRQPGRVETITINKKTFLVTADEGETKSYTSALHGFNWNDYTTARTIAAQIEDPDLKALASNDEYLGRLQVSSIDGKNTFTQMYTHLEAFGGRGFSIWDTSDFTQPIFDSEGTLEEYMEAWDKSVFNTDSSKSTESYQSPEILRDSVSDNLGAQVTGLDVMDDNGTMFLLVGTWSTGTLYLYTVDVTNGRPEPQFQTVYRRGKTDLPWRDLYQNKTIGDLYISDLGLISSSHSPTGRPMAYVVSEGAGQVSLYDISDLQPVIPTGKRSVPK